MKVAFNYISLEDLINYLISYGKFNQAALCRKWGLGTRTLYSILHGEAGNITYSNYTKLVGLCNEL